MDPVLRKMVRVGRVSSINPATCTARVAFNDESGMVSYDLPVVIQGSLKTKQYWMPQPDEQVLCLFLPIGIAQGFIIGAFYSDADKPPVTDANKRHISFPDGTSLEYDLSTKALTIDAKGPINIVAAGSVNVKGDVIADGISLKNHTHSDVQSGLSNSGPPVGGV